ncbi:peptidoglycan-binding protein [Kiloniella laminariae]|uniref:Peptidoglycan-binding protein n=1 Tax=Kiloniella laminariae TaxID=454162 RepID=A0ABT4LLK8_9PROT|nr:peptidoglycan-binding protein [Kiloniella laminariae]MCZ4281820.1 peptidoglycan-binding protein [Kiloniella laminariae]
MSDDKLKSTDEKPTSRKSRQPTKRKSTGTSKAGSPAKKVVAAKASKETLEKTLEKKETGTPREKTVSSAKAKDKSTTAAPSKTEEKKSDLKADSADKPGAGSGAYSETNKTRDTKKTAEEKAATTDEKQAPTTQSPRKIRTFTKMAAFAAILFFAVLFVYFYAQDVQLAKEKAPSLPLAATETPNLNASSPYGMRVEQLKEIEELLAVMDINTGAIDGKVDHETVAAISQFQEMSGLTVDGQPSPGLLEELKAVNTLLNSQ